MDPSTPYSTTSTVPLSHSTNSFHKPQQEQPIEQSADESFAPEEKFGVEPSKLLEQTLTTDDLPRRSGRSSVQSNMELQRRPRSSTDHSSSLVPVTSTPMSSDALVSNQQPESPPDIKPELLDLEPPMSPVAGPSHSADENSMMMYMDQSSMSTMPGPSGYQDNSALVSTDSQPQDTDIESEVEFDYAALIGEAIRQLPSSSSFQEGTNATLTICTPDVNAILPTFHDEYGKIMQMPEEKGLKEYGKKLHAPEDKSLKEYGKKLQAPEDKRSKEYGKKLPVAEAKRKEYGKKLPASEDKKLNEYGKILRVPEEERLKNASHLPEVCPRRRCAFCCTKEKQVRTKIMCKACKVPLCMSQLRNCFELFHSK